LEIPITQAAVKARIQAVVVTSKVEGRIIIEV
jgi:hypothetical protein